MNALVNINGISGGTLILMVGILALLTFLVAFRLKRYIDGAKAAGDVVKVLARPVKNIGITAVGYIFIAYFLNGHGICIGDVDFSAILVLAIGAINISFDMKPQVICENGIVTANGLVPWDIIAEILSINEKDHIVTVRLTKFVRENEMKLFCPSGEVHMVAECIESKIHKEA